MYRPGEPWSLPPRYFERTPRGVQEKGRETGGGGGARCRDQRGTDRGHVILFNKHRGKKGQKLPVKNQEVLKGGGVNLPEKRASFQKKSRRERGLTVRVDHSNFHVCSRGMVYSWPYKEYEGGRVGKRENLSF